VGRKGGKKKKANKSAQAGKEDGRRALARVRKTGEEAKKTRRSRGRNLHAAVFLRTGAKGAQ